MIEVEIEDSAWAEAVADPVGTARRAAESAAGGKRTEIVILLTDDATVQDLNARFLSKDRPTNVLAFPDATAGRLGDVALAFGICQAEASEQGKPLDHHLAHLVIHGVLHLIGYDHADDADATAMEALETRLLAEMNIPDPYTDVRTPI